jgi:hypothetical protein
LEKTKRTQYICKTKNLKHLETMPTNLSKAFAHLRKNGYFARQNFWCCQSCAWSAISEEQAEKAVFYHNQDHQDLKKGDDLYLAWAGDGGYIAETLKLFGLSVEWDGTKNSRIKVLSHTII